MHNIFGLGFYHFHVSGNGIFPLYFNYSIFFSFACFVRRSLWQHIQLLNHSLQLCEACISGTGNTSEREDIYWSTFLTVYPILLLTILCLGIQTSLVSLLCDLLCYIYISSITLFMLSTHLGAQYWEMLKRETHSPLTWQEKIKYLRNPLDILYKFYINLKVFQTNK